MTIQQWILALYLPVTPQPIFFKPDVPVPTTITQHGKPWKWIRIKNYYNWRSDQIYITTSPWQVINCTMSLPIADAVITDDALSLGATETVIFATDVLINNIPNLNFNKTKPWRRLTGDFFPSSISVALSGMPLGVNLIFNTSCVLELELSDEEDPPN